MLIGDQSPIALLQHQLVGTGPAEPGIAGRVGRNPMPRPFSSVR